MITLNSGKISFITSRRRRGEKLLGPIVGNAQRLYGIWECTRHNERCKRTYVTEYDKLLYSFISVCRSPCSGTCDAFHYLCSSKYCSN